MTTPSDPAPAADASHWRGIRRVVFVLTGAWVLISFVPAFFARELAFTVFDAPFAVWVAAQGAPILYVVLVWIAERRMDRLDRLDRERRAADGR